MKQMFRYKGYVSKQAKTKPIRSVLSEFREARTGKTWQTTCHFQNSMPCYLHSIGFMLLKYSQNLNLVNEKWTWTSGSSARMNGFVSISSSIVEGMVGSPALRCFWAHDNFSCTFTLSGSTVKANCKFFTVYWEHKTKCHRTSKVGNDTPKWIGINKVVNRSLHLVQLFHLRLEINCGHKSSSGNWKK